MRLWTWIVRREWAHRRQIQQELLGEAIRSIDKRPAMHPYARHRTKAGPIRHIILPHSGDGFIRGRVWAGMRKYGFIDIAVPERLSGRWRSHLYQNAVRSAIEEAWRC